MVKVDIHTTPTTIEQPAATISPSGTIQVRTGSLVSGITSADLTFQAGRLSGTINGKNIAPATISSNLQLQSLRYLDGTAVPALRYDPTLQAGITQLQSKATADLPNLRSRPITPAEVPSAGFQNTPFGYQSNSCESYLQGCLYTDAGCIATACILTLCIGAPACIATNYGCWLAGWIPGNACCKTLCAPLSCCDEGEQCCGSEVCCAQVCGNAEYGACCDSDAPLGCGDETEITCFPANSVCCPIGDSSIACPPNNVCLKGGLCCPTNMYCGGICCSAGQTCYTGTDGNPVCCDHPLCGGVCCEPPAQCVNNRCGVGVPCGNTFCGFAICCNGTCCAFNQSCVNGKCTPTTCPSGEVPCPVTPGQCCPRNFQCCANNKCCDTSTTECCGARGCVPKGTCIQ